MGKGRYLASACHTLTETYQESTTPEPLTSSFSTEYGALSASIALCTLCFGLLFSIVQLRFSSFILYFFHRGFVHLFPVGDIHLIALSVPVPTEFIQPLTQLFFLFPCLVSILALHTPYSPYLETKRLKDGWKTTKWYRRNKQRRWWTGVSNFKQAP